MGAKIRFVKGGTEIVLPAPAAGVKAALASGRVTGRTSGGAVYCYGTGARRYEAELPLPSLSAAERESLIAFYEDEAKAASETWTLFDAGGNGYTARFLDDSLVFTKAPGGGWDVVLRLELSALLA